MEIKNKIARKDRISNWWKLEGKIECGGALILLIVLVAFWDNLLVEAGGAFFGASWCIGKIYFRRDQWLALLLIALIMFQQGVYILFQYVRS